MLLKKVSRETLNSHPKLYVSRETTLLNLNKYGLFHVKRWLNNYNCFVSRETKRKSLQTQNKTIKQTLYKKKLMEIQMFHVKRLYECRPK